LVIEYVAVTLMRRDAVSRGMTNTDTDANKDDGPLSVWCAGEEWCPITSTATLIGKKWHPVIVHRLIENGPLGFNALKEEVDGVSSKVLSDSLDDLEEKRLVDRAIINEKPFRVEYSLTERGRSLEPVITAMREWGSEHLVSASDRESSVAD
jgi:DNA-binding HxlR family transcriptional regulator